MPFSEGQSGNPNGRPKGVPNKNNQATKTLIEALIKDNAESIKAEFAALSGKDKVKAFCDLLPYTVPKLQSTSLDIDVNNLTDEQLDELYERIISTSNK